MKYTSQKWFDGSWWEINIPERWVEQQSDAQHILIEGGTGNSFLIGLSKHSALHPSSRRDPWARKNLSETEEWAYTATKAEAYTVFPLGFIPIVLTIKKRGISKVELQDLKGYSYIKNEKNKKTRWAGFLYYKDWNIYFKLISTPNQFLLAKESAKQVLLSMKFGA